MSAAPATAPRYVRPSEALGLQPKMRMLDGQCWYACDDVAAAFRLPYGTVFHHKNVLTRYLRQHRLRIWQKFASDRGEIEHWLLNEAGLVACIMFIDCDVARDFRMACVPDLAERGIREDDAAVARPF